MLFIPGDQFLTAAVAEVADAARGCDPPGRDHRDAVELRRAAQGRRLRLAPECAGRERGADPRARRGAVQAARDLQRAPGPRRPHARSERRRLQQRGRARSNARCCPARASSPSSDCVPAARSRRSPPSRSSPASRAPWMALSAQTMSSGRRWRRGCRGVAYRGAHHRVRCASSRCCLPRPPRVRCCTRCMRSRPSCATRSRAPITTSPTRGCSGGAMRSIARGGPATPSGRDRDRPGPRRQARGPRATARADRCGRARSRALHLPRLAGARRLLPSRGGALQVVIAGALAAPAALNEDERQFAGASVQRYDRPRCCATSHRTCGAVSCTCRPTRSASPTSTRAACPIGLQPRRS